MVDDIVDDLSSFKRFHEFFIRKVKDRKIDIDLYGFTIPADSKIIAADWVNKD